MMEYCESLEFKQLKQITDCIVELVEVDQLYFSNQMISNSCPEVLVLIPNINRQHITEVKPIIRMALCKHHRFKYQIYYVDEVRRTISHGGCAFLHRCHIDNLLYIHPRSTLVLENTMDIRIYFRRALHNFELECARISAFKEGADFYFKKREMQLCVFMIHQVFEQLYRMAEVVFLGRGKISHRIRNHHDLLKPYVPELLSIFDNNQEYDMTLLNLLDDSYLSVRYENTFDILAEDLECLLIKAVEMEQLIKEKCSEMLDFYQNIYRNL